MSDSPHIDPSSLPDATNETMDFLDSSFFKAQGPRQRLPTPAEVEALARTRTPSPKPSPVVFGQLDLIVKFGPRISVAEAHCLWIVSKVLGNELPVPEVYGWRVDEGRVYIYMQLVRGDLLTDRWDSLNVSEQTNVCQDLRQMITSLRRVKQLPDDSFIVNREGVSDRIFEFMPENGPFATVATFHDWISWLMRRPFLNAQNIPDPWRPLLPDTDGIRLTHGDLHQRNIIISSIGPPRVIALIDWGQAGWYPDYWEYCKACYTAWYEGEWRSQWMPTFLDARDDEFFVIAEYSNALGAV